MQVTKSPNSVSTKPGLPQSDRKVSQEIAECFDVHYATVSRAVKQSEANV